MKLKFADYGLGQAVVFLHAFPLSRSMWTKQAEAISAEGWRVVTPDFPGFGESALESETSKMEDMAQGVADLLSELKIKQAVIAGLSMGGYVALNFVKMFPEKVSGLILADTSAEADLEEKRKSRFVLIEKITESGSKVLISELLPKVVSEHTKTTKPELVASIKAEFRKARDSGVIAALSGMAARKDQTEFLKNIKSPTLLIFGEDDEITNFDAAGILKREIPNSTLIKLPNAGHYSNIEQPEMFNKAIIDFLKQLK